jgi:hypothetical protein
MTIPSSRLYSSRTKSGQCQKSSQASANSPSGTEMFSSKSLISVRLVCYLYIATVIRRKKYPDFPPIGTVPNQTDTAGISFFISKALLTSDNFHRIDSFDSQSSSYSESLRCILIAVFSGINFIISTVHYHKERLRWNVTFLFQSFVRDQKGSGGIEQF